MDTFVFLVEDVKDAGFILEDLACYGQGEMPDDNFHLCQYKRGSMEYIPKYDGHTFPVWKVTFSVKSGFTTAEHLKTLIDAQKNMFPWDYRLAFHTLEEENKFNPKSIWSVFPEKNFVKQT